MNDGIKQNSGEMICTRCILDNTVPDIKFDDKGVCNYCHIHDEMAQLYPGGKAGAQKLAEIAEEIKTNGKGKEYDCIVGVSGGTDSTYTLYLACELGLKPLAVHFDNGWNSEISVSNIKNATEKLKIDLHTVVANWEEFKDLQVSFLKASVPDAEVPTDYAITSVLFQTAARVGIQYILEGHGFRAEGTSPRGWTYQDSRYIKSIHRKYGSMCIKSFPILSLLKLSWYLFVRKIRYIRPLEYIHYSKKAAQELLKEKLGWRDYGGHHHESIYTQFFQSYLLPNKFGIDKRKREYSAQIRAGEMTRETAIKKIHAEEYPVDKQIVDYTICKLGLSKQEFAELMKIPPKSFVEYPNYYSIIRRFRFFIKVACKVNILPFLVYFKYAEDISGPLTEHWKRFAKSRIDG